MKISDYKGEQAIDLLADLIDPITEICEDKELLAKIKDAYASEKSLMQLAKPLLKNHKKSIIEIIAAIDGVKPEECEITLFTFPVRIVEILNEPELRSLFTSQSQMKEETHSGSASGKTE